MDTGLKDRIAVVTGASRGLGRAVARGLAGEGCHLAVCSRGEKDLNKAAKALTDDFGVRVFHRPVNLNESGAAAEFCRAACAHFGRVDILVANNGGPPVGRNADFGEEDWLKAVNMTLLPPQAMARELLPGMEERGWGRVINLTSVSVKQPLPGLILSNSIRSAVVGWAKTLADEVGPKGVTVNNVCPGWIRTERVEAIVADRMKAEGKTREEVLAEVARAIPLGRVGEPDELAGLVVFLASERASYITGATYLVDGGLYRGLM